MAPGQQVARQASSLLPGDVALLVLPLVDQRVAPLALAVLADAQVERGVAAGEPTVHLDHLAGLDREVAGDAGHGLRRQVAAAGLAEPALEPAQVEEQLLLRGRGASFTIDQLCRMCSWIAALIHHMA